MWPHRRQPTRLPGPWDSPGKNTGVGCHFLLQCMKGKSESEVAQSCPTQRPHGLQPTRLLCPWDFPGNSTGVGCHCLLRCPLLAVWFGCHLHDQFVLICKTKINITVIITDLISCHTEGTQSCPPSLAFSSYGFASYHGFCWMWDKKTWHKDLLEIKRRKKGCFTNCSQLLCPIFLF